MPTPYTSARSGLWDASDVDTWGQGVGVYPQTAADVVNVGHTVTYNKVSTTEMGAITITTGGILTFLNSMSTKLTLGQQDITINSGGELRVGASGAIIPKTYTAELIWNTTGDNNKGISVASGGKLTIYGDPDYFGSDFDTILVSQAVIPAAGNAVTITIAGDFTTKWVPGQELIVHKGGSYGSGGYTNDFCRLAITSVAANGSNTDVACTVTERPVALTCLVGADVLNLSRNVLLYKLGYNANLGNVNTLRPRLANSNAIATFGTNNINISDAVFGGWYGILVGYNIYFNGVFRNGNRPSDAVINSSIAGIIFSSSGLYRINNSTCSAIIAGMVSFGLYGCIKSVFSGNIFGNGAGIADATALYKCVISGNVYSNGVGLYSEDYIFTGNLGYDGNGVSKANTTDISFGTNYYGIVKMLNNKVPTSPVIAGRNSLVYKGRFCFEHYQQITNAHYICDAYGDITKTAADGAGDNPTQRSSGSADVIEVIPQSNCAAASYLELLNIRLWATVGVSKTYRFYVQTDYASLLTAAFKLYGEYLNQGSGGHLATVSSTQNITTRANAADWSQYVEVTINPAQTGYVNLYIWLMGYESTKKVWIDPMVSII